MAVHHHHHHTIAHHVQVRIRLMLAPSTMPLFFCGSILVMLALVSLIIGPLLDLDLPLRHHGHPHFLHAWPQLNQNVVTTNVSHVYLANVSTVAEILPGTIWASPLAKFYHGCSSPSKSFPRRVPAPYSNGYIFVETSGGLNQQRIGITDAVVVARFLNATLIVPFLDHGSFWRDNSNFSDVFDVDWFMASLAPDVNILKEIPARLGITREMLYSTRAPRRSEPDYYIRYILPLLKRKKAIRLTKFDYRLASSLEESMQKLRCRVNYSALRFTEAIANMGRIIVRRLRKKGGRYIALHLRFEPDMLAFTGCYYGGGEKERRELGELRKRWTTLSPLKLENVRRSGKCPLTPEEVGLMLQALGFNRDSHIYVASGEVYGGEANLAPLRALFPNFHTKDTLATFDELEPFASYTTRMAAIDYIVCEESDVFITNYNGNMVKILAGSRRYHGHKRTIQPNVKKLGSLFLSRQNITWKAFSTKLRHVQRGYVGEPNELRPGGDFFEYPDACICRNQGENVSFSEASVSISEVLHEGRKDEDPNEFDTLDEQDMEIGEEEILHLQNADLANEVHAGDEQDMEIGEEEILHLQHADLANEAHAGGGQQAEIKETEEIPWLSD